MSRRYDMMNVFRDCVCEVLHGSWNSALLSLRATSAFRQKRAHWERNLNYGLQDERSESAGGNVFDGSCLRKDKRWPSIELGFGNASTGTW